MTDEELRILTWTILGEAGGDGTAGMTAVAHVLLNRSVSGRFPANPASAAIQSNGKGIYQFSAWNAIDKGGNLPRSKYPVNSEAFARGLAVVNKVFSAVPGPDPTRGATHYYAPSGMEGGKEPWWWYAENRRGDAVRVGGNIFAARRDAAVAPTPATRGGGMTPVGNYPTERQFDVLVNGPAQLPKLAAPKDIQQNRPPMPRARPERDQPTSTETAKPPRRNNDAPEPVLSPNFTVSEQQRRMELELGIEKSEGAVITNFIYDPVRKTLIPEKMSTSDLVRAAGGAKKAQTHKAVERTVTLTGTTADVTPSITTGQTTTWVKPFNDTRPSAPSIKLPKPSGAQTQFTAPKLPGMVTPVLNTGSFSPLQPKGVVGVDESRLLPSIAPGGGVPYGSGAPLPGMISAPFPVRGVPSAATPMVPNMPPMPRPVPVRAPPLQPIVVPPKTPLSIVVSGSNPITQVIAQPPKPKPISVVQSIKNEGHSAAEAYDIANERAAQKARDNAGPSGGTQVYSPGRLRYDRTTGNWV